MQTGSSHSFLPMDSNSDAFFQLNVNCPKAMPANLSDVILARATTKHLEWFGNNGT